MARFPRVVVPNVPHHVTQRASRRLSVFFSPEDYRTYTEILARQARRHALDIWAYCLMPNHVHLIVAPSTEEGLARPLGETHRRYACLVNERYRWSGHLWQERFSSFPMDEPHLRAALRYVLLNPVRAGLVKRATDWPFSSARAQVMGTPDGLVNTVPAAERVLDWDRYLRSEGPPETETLRDHDRAGRPLGSDRFIDRLEKRSGRRLRPRKRGRKPGRG